MGSTHRENEREQITRAADESFQSPSSSSSSHLSRQPAPQPASASLRTTSPSYTKSYETHQCLFLAENKLFTHFITLKEKKRKGTRGVKPLVYQKPELSSIRRLRVNEEAETEWSFIKKRSGLEGGGPFCFVLVSLCR